ncbi:GH1 family beta-glucosidase [Cellulomonas sp. McL0617]|uniref:GH1 family beta-glucosidase n=1 Tax=Cellulomonas sp. McL0617 TaxID=3415675 RepID=UPI003CFAFDCA
MTTPRPSGRRFPDDFLWGSATASYQIEGAVHEGGRAPSIWDTFSRTPGKVQDGDTGDVAVDHFHRVPQDVAMMADLGLQAYRFSISWSRVQPDGSGAFLQAGLDFYSDLVDRLIAARIKPVATLYHWDLPQALEDEGGWANRRTAILFGEYARKMAEVLGDRIHLWTTLNEPWCSAYLGYASGVHAPGRTDDVSALRAVHHLNLAHGLAGRAVKDVLGQDTPVSVTLNLHVTRAATDAPEDLEAKRQIDTIGNEVFLRPMLDGEYPKEVFADTEHLTDWSFVQDEDLDIIQVPLAVLGINYYSTGRVRWGTPEVGDGGPGPDGHRSSASSPWVGATNVEFLPQPGPHTAMGWNIEPEGLVNLLVEVHERYPALPLAITENGAAFDDEVTPDGRVHDVDRVAYLHDHIDAVGEAIKRGVDVRGYFVWSLMDNFEWSYGYSKRFGVVRVDYDTLERTVKDSGLWYSDLIATNAIPAPAPHL